MLRSLFLVLALSLPFAAAAKPVILVFGDSLSAEYGLAAGQGWPALLARRLEADRLPYALANASISGETTAGGRSRLPAALEHFHPQVLVLALSANDGLRGLPVTQMRDNLRRMIRAGKAVGARILLVGMRLPPNYGPDYTRDFEASFGLLAKEEKTALLPFLLEPIASDDAAFLPDRLHPSAAAQPKIADHVWQALRPLLKP